MQHVALDLHHLEQLFQIGLLLNLGYALFRRSIGSPLGNYIRVERDIRGRLRKIERVEDPELLKEKKRIAAASGRSERTLRLLLRLSSVSMYLAAAVSFGILVLAAFTEQTASRGAAIALIVFVYYPVPLTLLTLWAASKVYLGRLEKALMGLATKLEIKDAILSEAGGGGREHLLSVAMTQLETALEKGGKK